MVKSFSIDSSSPLTGHHYRALAPDKQGMLLLTRTAPNPDGTKIPIGAFDIIGLHRIGTGPERPCIAGTVEGVPWMVPSEAEFALLGITSKVIWV